MSIPDHLSVDNFSAALRDRGRLLGIDLGSKTIGLSISDSQWSVASPVSTIRRTKFTRDAEQIDELVKRENVQGLVLGWPVNMDGSAGPRAQSTLAFVRNLDGIVVLPTMLWDERLTTLAADQAMLEADLSRAKRSRNVDQIAAAIILQGAMDRLCALQTDERDKP